MAKAIVRLDRTAAVASNIAWSHVAEGRRKASMHLACMQQTSNDKSRDS